MPEEDVSIRNIRHALSLLMNSYHLHDEVTAHKTLIRRLLETRVLKEKTQELLLLLSSAVSELLGIFHSVYSICWQFTP